MGAHYTFLFFSLVYRMLFDWRRQASRCGAPPQLPIVGWPECPFGLLWMGAQTRLLGCALFGCSTVVAETLVDAFDIDRPLRLVLSRHCGRVKAICESWSPP